MKVVGYCGCNECEIVQDKVATALEDAYKEGTKFSDNPTVYWDKGGVAYIKVKELVKSARFRKALKQMADLTS